MDRLLRLQRFLASSFLVGSSVTTLWACGGGGGSSASDDPFAPPAGCTRTQCDVDHDSCTGEQQNQCSECESLCENPYADSSCFDTCANICADPSRGSSCEDEYTSCRQTKENTECVSGTGSDAGSDASTGDASAADGGVDAGRRTDAAVDASAAVSASAACTLADPGVLPDTPPSGQSVGACTAAEIAAVSAQVDADGATLRGVIGQTSASCQACALSQVSDATWGAFVEITPQDLMLNQGACVSQVDATCGSEVNALFLCVNEACSTCTDATSYADCSTTAMSGFCADYAVDDSCQSETTSGDAVQCFPGDATDVQLAQTILTLQCGSM
jgi:hypothetical protein